MAYVLFLVLCVVWGTSFLLMKKATAWYTPISVGELRVAGGAVFLLVVVCLRRRPWPLSRQYFGPVLVVALLGYSWPFALQPYLVQHCGSGFIGMMVSFVPLLTILVSIPMLGVYPTARQLIGVVVGLAFLLLILYDGIDRELSLPHFLLATSVPLSYALSNTYIKRRFTGVPPLPITLACLGTSTAILLPLAAAQFSQPHAASADFPLATTCVLILGVVGTGFGVAVFTKLVQDHGPLFAGMVTYLIPSIAVLIGWLDDEPVTVKQLIALIGVLNMVALVQFGTARRRS